MTTTEHPGTCATWCGTTGDDLPTRESNVWIYNRAAYGVNHRFCTESCRDAGRPLNPAPAEHPTVPPSLHPSVPVDEGGWPCREGAPGELCPACESTTGCACSEFDVLGAVVERNPIPSVPPLHSRASAAGTIASLEGTVVACRLTIERLTGENFALQRDLDATRRELAEGRGLLAKWHGLAVLNWQDHRTTNVDAETRAFLATLPEPQR